MKPTRRPTARTSMKRFAPSGTPAGPGLDVDEGRLGEHQGAIDGRRDGERIVDERAVEAVVAIVELEVEAHGVADESKHRIRPDGAGESQRLRRHRAGIR